MVYLDILRKGLYSVIIVFSSISLWIDWTVVLHPSCVTGLRVCSHFELSFGACEIRTFLTTSRFADSHRVAIGLHATAFVSLYICLAKYFCNILFHNYLSIIVYFVNYYRYTLKLNCCCFKSYSNSVFRSHLLKSEPAELSV